MTKKVREAVTAKPPMTAEEVLACIDAMTQPERRRLLDLLGRHPDNKWAPLWNVIAIAENLEEMRRKLREVEEEISRECARCCDLEEELQDSVPKRKMSAARIETAEAYRRLLKQHAKASAALLALVKLPGEQGKNYARKYRESGDLEALRQYVKSLMGTYKNYLARP